MPKNGQKEPEHRNKPALDCSDSALNMDPKA